MFFAILRLMCVAVFSAAIPVLVWWQFKYAKLLAWHVIAITIAVGWLLVYAHISLRGPMIHALDRAELEAEEEYKRHPPPPIQNQNPDGSVETFVDNPYGMGTYMPEVYHPIASLLYGPIYLIACWLGAWLFYRISPRERRRRLLLAAVSALLIEWTVLCTHPIVPPKIFSDEVFIYGWNSFFGPQLTLPLALIIGWLLVVLLPTVSRRATGAP